jgi:hypothetical protein
MTTLSELERRVTALEEQERARAFLRQAMCEGQRMAASRACEQMDREIISGPASNNLSRRVHELVRQAQANFEDPQMGELA